MKYYILEVFEDVFPGILIILVACIILGGIAGLLNWGHSFQCHKYGEVTGRETKWVTLDDCYIKLNGQFVTYDEYKIREFPQQLKVEVK